MQMNCHAAVNSSVKLASVRDSAHAFRLHNEILKRASTPYWQSMNYNNKSVTNNGTDADQHAHNFLLLLLEYYGNFADN